MKRATVNPLRAYRVENDMTLDELSQVFGVNKSTLMRWEVGAVKVPAERVLTISQKTGISPSALRPDLYPESMMA